MIRLFDTFSREIKDFKPIEEGKVGIYSCGPTVYDYPHIGNLRAYIFSDVLRRVFEFNNYDVKQVMNITDVGHLTSDADTGEDKIEKGAKREHKSAREIADFYTGVFLENIKELNIEKPSYLPKATDHIQEQIDLIKRLKEKGYTYNTSDGVYFDTSKFPDYGRLARLDIEGLKAGSRVDMKEKKSPTDFALWKLSIVGEQRQMEWDSPWGKGYPGWHLECSAMSMKYLGSTFDIHTGGIDHIPVHHTNEIAQSEAATGKPLANYWMHSEFLQVQGEKMAKSAGTFITLSEIKKKGIDPLAFRYLCLEAHYRSKIDFSFESLEGAQKGLQGIRDLAYRQEPSEAGEEASNRVLEAFNDDLDTPKALALLHKENNVNLWLKFDPILGLNLAKKEVELTKEQEAKISEREEARKNGDFEKSDKIRKELEKEGITIEDTENGTRILSSY
ncbi:MAG: cysteine--tRNA ligase [Candidatus Berkelbacteria bacterium]|nr:cysteine--tRNA ligase [Candidatus Berkelbacteria bacterium]